jgi:hypothetical protein
VNEEIKKRIEKRAYELFIARGGQHGYHFDDWIKAEKEVLAEIEKEKQQKAKSAKPAAKAGKKIK